MALHIALIEPEIPANTGNISRTCVATDTHLHLVGKLGFSLDDKQLKRAGLDYWYRLKIDLWDSFDELISARHFDGIYYASTKTKQVYSDIDYPDNSLIVFGKETAGLPESMLIAHPERGIRIPMHAENRSLNLSNSVAICVYEYYRQQGFPGMLLGNDVLIDR